ncbi:hypothetical protein [Streptomyces katrae]|uniref:hypothetical protein n=1 Tax=Streptomyces katrae TaxID=68223 RepID=UPI0004C02FCB|nr:hypothetical protein [Streptomyces katrae]
MRSGGRYDMIIALVFILFLGLIAAVALGLLVGCVLLLAMLLSFLASLASGATFLGLVARKRRAPRPAPAGQGW